MDEEEAWLNEKTALLSSEEGGDTLATVQVGKAAMPTNIDLCIDRMCIFPLSEFTEEARCI